ncbi:uncharacterized protein TNCV_5034251 [Trichonephila clavipes]|nr:uncharacterized protein TNCV_5034251 [Trichonephila clavipes]
MLMRFLRYRQQWSVTNNSQTAVLFNYCISRESETLQRKKEGVQRYRTVACFVTGSSPAPLKTRRVGQRCTLNLSRAETSSRWRGVVVRRGGASSGVVHVTGPWFKITWSVAKSPRVAEQCDVNIQSITQFGYLNNHACERCPVSIDSDKRRVLLMYNFVPAVLKKYAIMNFPMHSRESKMAHCAQ